MRFIIADKPVRRRLFGVLSGVFPLVIFAAIMLALFTQQQEKAIRRLLFETAHNAAHVVEQAIGEQISLLNGLAASRALDTGDFETFRQDAQRLWEKHPEWHTVVLTDEEKPLFNLFFPAGEPIPPLQDPLSLKKVWDSSAPYIGNLVLGTTAIRVPVIRNDRIRYTLVAPISPHFFKDKLMISREVQAWKFIIVDGNSVIISSSIGAPLGIGQPLQESFWQNSVDAQFPGEMRYADPMPIESWEWRIFVFAPAASVEMPFVMRRLAVFLGGALAVIITAALVLTLSTALAVKQESISLRNEINKRIIAQQAHKESEQRFRLLVENAPDAIFVQTEGMFTYLNNAAAQLFGAQEIGELLGRPLIERFHPDYRQIVEERIQQFNNGIQPTPRMIGVCLRMNGSRVDVDSSAVRFEYDGKRGSLVFMRDITDHLKAQARRKDLEEKLNQAQRLESVGRLAGGVAHDFNNMLGVIIGYVELAMENAAPEKPLYHDLQEILTAAKRSSDITRQLLAFARQQPIAPKVLDLNDTVESMLKMLRRLIGENIDLIWKPGDRVWPVKMDPTQIDQILANLCVNARDAIADVGKIVIDTKNISLDEAYCARYAGFAPGDFVMLAVSDDGCGMDKETLTKIFDPFFTTKEMGRGTGLGLATVFGIVKQNDGFVDVYSETGKGTSFNLYLPGHPGEAVEGQKTIAGRVPMGHHELVIVVEDETAILKLAQKMLKSLGYKVLAAKSPNEALHFAKGYAGDISLLMTDVVMPGMNGRELAEQLQELYPEMRSLFMSGYTADVIAHRGVLAKGVHFIQKPFSLNELAFKVDEALHSDHA